MTLTVKKIRFLLWEWEVRVNGKYIDSGLTSFKRTAERQGNKRMASDKV